MGSGFWDDVSEGGECGGECGLCKYGKYAVVLAGWVLESDANVGALYIRMPWWYKNDLRLAIDS